MKKQTPSIVTKIFVPVASAAIIAISGILYNAWQSRNDLGDQVIELKAQIHDQSLIINHKLDSFITLTNTWVAHLDEEMAEEQKRRHENH